MSTGMGVGKMFIGVDSWFVWEMQELGAFPAVCGGLLCQVKRTAIRSWSELSGHGDGRLSSQFNLRDLPEFRRTSLGHFHL